MKTLTITNHPCDHDLDCKQDVVGIEITPDSKGLWPDQKLLLCEEHFDSRMERANDHVRYYRFENMD